jgi:methyl-accepting chemotaxis protein
MFYGEKKRFDGIFASFAHYFPLVAFDGIENGCDHVYINLLISIGLLFLGILVFGIFRGISSIRFFLQRESHQKKITVENSVMVLNLRSLAGIGDQRFSTAAAWPQKYIKGEVEVKAFGNMSTKGKILALVLIMAALLSGVGFLGYNSATKADETMESMYSDLLVPVGLIYDSLVHGRGIQSSLYALMLTTDEKENQALLADILRRRETVDRNIAAYEKTDLTAFEKEHLPKAKEFLMQYRPFIAKAQELARENKNAEAYELFKSQALPLFDKYQGEMRALGEFNRETALKTYHENNEISRVTIRTIVGLSFAAVILAVLLGLFIASRIAGPLNRLRAGVEQFAAGDLTVQFQAETKDEIGRMGAALEEMAEKLRDSMKAIAAAAERLGSNSEEFSALAEESNAGVEESRAGIDDVSSQMENLAAASQEINASVEEVAGGAQSSAQKSTEMATEVEQARVAGEEGTKAVDKVVKSISKVAEDAGRSAQEVRSLGDRAREIQSFVSQIGGIADQTNLLALNAAIEAARAGEAGRGFAVVAEEVRKLAEESNEAAKKIAELASGITKDLDSVMASSEGNAKDSVESSTLAEETRTTIGRMMDALSRISSSTQDLAAVSEEQAASSEEIAGAVQNIASRVSGAASSSDMVRGQMAEVAASAERVAQGSEELANLSAELRKLVGYFRFDHGTENRGLVPSLPGASAEKKPRAKKR